MGIALLNKLRYGHVENKWIAFMCEDGRSFKLPMRVVAFDRARYYAEDHSVDGIQSSLDNDTIELFLDDWYAIDWMRNNMDYEEFKDMLVQIRDVTYVDESIKAGWSGGAYWSL